MATQTLNALRLVVVVLLTVTFGISACAQHQQRTTSGAPSSPLGTPTTAAQLSQPPTKTSRATRTPRPPEPSVTPFPQVALPVIGPPIPFEVVGQGMVEGNIGKPTLFIAINPEEAQAITARLQHVASIDDVNFNEYLMLAVAYGSIDIEMPIQKIVPLERAFQIILDKIPTNRAVNGDEGIRDYHLVKIRRDRMNLVSGTELFVTLADGRLVERLVYP